MQRNTWKIILTLACAAIQAASALSFAERPYDAVCNVDAPLGSGVSAGGSGTMIYKDSSHAVVITANHVLEECAGGITVDFPSSPTKFAARVIASDPVYDIAALAIQPPEGIEPPIGVKAPTKDDGPFIRVGFPWNGNGRQCWNRGNYLGFPRNDGQSAWARSMLHTTGIVESGFSGGAVFTSDGYFCGVVSGNTSPDASVPMDRTWGASGNVLVEFCQRCCGGNCPVYVVPQRSPRQVVVQQVNPAPPPTIQPKPASWTDPQWIEWREKIEAEIAACKPCQCDHSHDVTMTQVNQAIAAAIAEIKFPAQQIYTPPTPQQQAEQIAPYLHHSATIQLLDGTKKTQTRPLNVPLDFIQRSVVKK